MRHAYYGRVSVLYACLFMMLVCYNAFATRSVSSAESPNLDTKQTDQVAHTGVKDSFDDAVQAVKDRNFQRAIQLFSKLSQIVQYDGQY